MTTVNKTAAMVENEAIQPVFSEELPSSMQLGLQHEEITNTASNKRITTPSVKEIEAKVAHMASKPGLRSKVNANCL